MRFPTICLAIILLLILNSCDQNPIAIFTDPQPEHINNLSQFPKKLQGNYLNLEDSSIININEKQIIRPYSFYQKLDIHQLDSNTVIQGDSILFVNTNEKFKIKKEADSIEIRAKIIDTLFEMNYDNVVKKYKGYYFLNKRFDKNGWEIIKLSYKKGKLSFGSIQNEQEINQLNTLTDTPTDSIVPHKYSISQKEFNSFLRNDGFSNNASYIKL